MTLGPFPSTFIASASSASLPRWPAPIAACLLQEINDRRQDKEEHALIFLREVHGIIRIISGLHDRLDDVPHDLRFAGGLPERGLLQLPE
jgi:hypothetical protein